MRNYPLFSGRVIFVKLIFWRNLPMKKEEKELWKSPITKILALSCTFLLLLTACRNAGAPAENTRSRPYTVGIVTKSGTSEYWMTVHQGMEVAAGELGMDIIFLSPDSETNEEAQIKMVETLIKRKVSIIAVSPIDSYERPSYFDMALDAGIPIVSYDTGFSDLEVPYIGIDNEKAGQELARYLAEELEHKGEVGIISGDLKQMSHRQRMEGFLSYMDTEPEIHVAFTESGYSNLRMTEEKVRKLREEYPLVQGIIATSAVTAIGITESIPESEVRIVSIDIQEDAIDAVRDGKIAALIAQSGYDIGYQTIQYIYDFLADSTEASDKILEAELLTEQNVDAYIERNIRNEKYSQ